MTTAFKIYTRSVASASLMLLTACNVQAPLMTDNGRFEKLDIKGTTLPDQAPNWSCIRDRQNGLVWEHKTKDEGLRHYSWTYSWADSRNYSRPHSKNDASRNNTLSRHHTYSQGSCNLRDIRLCDTQHYIEALKRQQLCGLSTWRLPAPEELIDIAKTHQTDNAPPVKSALNPFTFKNIKQGSYWSELRGPVTHATTFEIEGTSATLKPSHKRPSSPNFLYILAVATPKDA